MMLLLNGCSIDNYDAPNAELYGEIVDKTTGEPVFQPVETETGLKIRLYEADRTDGRAQDFYARKDGGFRNSMLFSGPFKITMEATNFFPVDTIQVRVKGSTRLDIPVTPFCRIHVLSVALTGDSVAEEVKDTTGAVVGTRFRLRRQVALSFSLERDSDANCKILQYDIYWHLSPNIDKNSVNHKGTWTVDVAQEKDSVLLGRDRVFKDTVDLETGENADKLRRYIHIVKGNKDLIYFRIAVRTVFPYVNESESWTVYTNYSDIYPVTIPVD
jgi:hypothetical protein